MEGPGVDVITWNVMVFVHQLADVIPFGLKRYIP